MVYNDILMETIGISVMVSIGLLLFFFLQGGQDQEQEVSSINSTWLYLCSVAMTLFTCITCTLH